MGKYLLNILGKLAQVAVSHVALVLKAEFRRREDFITAAESWQS